MDKEQSNEIYKVLNIDDMDYLLIYFSDKSLISINITHAIQNKDDVNFYSNKVLLEFIRNKKLWNSRFKNIGIKSLLKLFLLFQRR